MLAKDAVKDDSMLELNADPVLVIETGPFDEDIELDASDCWIISLPPNKVSWDYPNSATEMGNEKVKNSYGASKTCYNKPVGVTNGAEAKIN